MQTGLSSRPASRTIEMLFRFWGSGGEAAGSLHPGLLALVEDAVAARRGVFVSGKDQLYVSGFEQPADALVVSRQVQLGMQGFRGKHASGPVAVSVAIDAVAAPGAANVDAAPAARQTHEPPHDLVTLLKLARPAQVLLTNDLCRQVEEIRGLPLKSFPARFGVYEYLWTAEEKLDLLQSEPQLTLAALPVAAKEKPAAPAANDASVRPPDPSRSHADIVPRRASAFQSPRMLIMAASAVAVLALVIFAAIHFSHHTPAQTTPASSATPVRQSPPPQPSAPAPAAAPPAAPALAEKPRAHKPASRQAEPASAKAEEKQTAPTPAPAANCVLGANPERFVSLAEQARSRGDYANAIRIFREVLACDPNSAAAREGLDKAASGEQSQH